MAMSFTPEQQKVIELHDRNILVSAAAGSGKTAVLVERIIQMISDKEKKVDIDRLLVVTFTNAAAAEMRERISLAISKKLEEEPDNEHLQKQSALIHNAQITTIDSFCLFLIRNNFNDIGLDPGFRVADEGELKLLRQDVMTELLEEKYAQKEEAFLNCVEYFTGGSDDKLLETYLLGLYDFSVSYPWPDEWLEERINDYKITDVFEMESTDWCRYIAQYIRKLYCECADKLASAIKLAQLPAGPYYYGELLEKERDMLLAAAGAETFAALHAGAEKLIFGRLPGKKDDSVSEAYKEKAKQLRGEVKKQIEDCKERFFVLSGEQIVERMQRLWPVTETLMKLALEFKQRFDEKKRQENILDFSDMEHFALEILLEKKEDGSYEATSAAKEYRRYFHEILIDEYQDSNLVQELLLQSISGEEEGNYNRFMVGDVKQSIYKFRLARPELFIEKYNCYSKVDSIRQRIDLHKNFRSRKEVLESVNQLFYRIMDSSLGGVTYDEDAALYPGAEYPEYGKNQTEVILIGKDKQSRLSAREQEATVIAGKIKELIREFQVTDKSSGQLRPVRYSDIVILLRTTSGWAEEFKAVFDKEGVPSCVALQTGYFEAVEVRELLQLLHVLDNPLQDIPLFGVMKSFFGKFTEEEIAWIQSKGSKKSFLYENLQNFVQQEAQNEERTALGTKVEAFLGRMQAFRNMSSYTPIHRLIQEILTQTGYPEYILAKPGGRQRHANVEMLLTKAAAFEQTSYYGLFHFLRYIEQLEKYQVDYGEADIQDENADVVRIMSIHKSKGLEFPVCFVAGLSKKFNMRDTTGRLIADVDLGLGVDYVDSERRIMGRTLRKAAVSMKMKLDSLGEELRVLYVAMTRAKEKLFLSALVNDVEKYQTVLSLEKEFSSLLPVPAYRVPFSVLASASSYLDFITPCLDVDRVNWVLPSAIVVEEVVDTVRLTELKGKLLLSEPDNFLVTNLSQKMDRAYPYQYLENLFVKTTVSELKKSGQGHLSEESISAIDGGKERGVGDASFTKILYEEAEVVPYIPSFIRQEEEMSGTDRGSAYHKVMELLDFAALWNTCYEKKADAEKVSADEVREWFLFQLRSMEEQQKITAVQREAVSERKIINFLQTSLAKRMAKAAAEGKLYKEQPFVMGLAANRIDSTFPEKEMILIQGIIDVYFEEEDAIVVADYKTDRVISADELVERYHLQLEYYADALQRLTGKTVKEREIYSFALGNEIKL